MTVVAMALPCAAQLPGRLRPPGPLAWRGGPRQVAGRRHSCGVVVRWMLSQWSRLDQILEAASLMQPALARRPALRGVEGLVEGGARPPWARRWLQRFWRPASTGDAQPWRSCRCGAGALSSPASERGVSRPTASWQNQTRMVADSQLACCADSCASERSRACQALAEAGGT